MEGYAEPHSTQIWLVDAFFRLHRRRPYSENGPMPISFSDIIGLSDTVLGLSGHVREMYLQVVESTDSEVLEYLYAKNSAKLEEIKANNANSKKLRGSPDG